MEKWKQIYPGLFLLLIVFTNVTESYRNSKRQEIESELYKNILPYIKVVERDAAKARSEIKNTKIKKKHHNKAKLLKEVDQKVIPWLDELTKKTKEHQNKGFTYQLRHFPHNIHGPSALKLNQVETIGQDKKDIEQLFTENKQEKHKRNESIGLLQHLKKESETSQAGNRSVIMNKQEVAGAMLMKPTGDQQHLMDDMGTPTENENAVSINEEEAEDRDIASEVAKITNEIAEFQENIKHLTNGKIIGKKKSKAETDPFVSKPHLTKENKETVGSTDNLRKVETPHFDESMLVKKKLNNETTYDMDITDLANNSPDLITKGLFEPKASLFKEKLEKQDELIKTLKTDTPKTLQISNEKSGGNMKIIFGGNIGFDGIVQYKVEAGICTYNESFDKVKKFLDDADHVVVSLDSPFRQQNKTQSDDDDEEDVSFDHPAYTFGYAGIDTVVLANNHILDYGPGAAKYTAAMLRDTNTLYSGLTFSLNPKKKQEPVIYATNGVTVGILSYCMNKDGCSAVRNKTKIGPAIFNTRIVKEEVLALRESGIDIVCLYLHWGDEDDLLPSFEVKEIIRNISIVKIDVIVGNHPNIDGHYYFRGTLVVLSLGTFLTPLHIQIYKTNPSTSKHSKFIEKLWDKQSERWEMPSLNSKLLQIEVNRDGLVPFKAKYLPIQMNLNKNHCLQTDREKKEWWIPICTRQDKQCMGSSKCNELECDPSLTM